MRTDVRVALATVRVFLLRFASNPIMVIRGPLTPILLLIAFRLAYSASGHNEVSGQSTVGFLVIGMLGTMAWNAAIWGVVLILADLAGRKRRGLAEIGPRTGLAIGCAQALALIPGTSRSGVTMSAALGLGFDRDTAARFSFLLSVPVGILVAAKQGLDIVRGVPLGVPASSLVVGIAVSAIAGYGVIAFLLGWVRRHSLWVFGVYRLLLAGFLFYYLS